MDNHAGDVAKCITLRDNKIERIDILSRTFDGSCSHSGTIDDFEYKTLENIARWLTEHGCYDIIF